LFSPGDREEFEMVIDSSEMSLWLKGLVDGQPTEARITKNLPAVPNRQERRFQFLEPRRILSDVKKVFRVQEDGDQPIHEIRAAFPVYGGEQYDIVIQPKESGLTSIELREIIGHVHVRKSEHNELEGTWRFLVEITSNESLSRPERLFYIGKRGEEELLGNIPLCLKPSWGKQFRLACYLGAALTLQGASALARLAAGSYYSIEQAISNFTFTDHYQLLFPLCIPLLWLVLRLFDVVQYRLRY